MLQSREGEEYDLAYKMPLRIFFLLCECHKVASDRVFWLHAADHEEEDQGGFASLATMREAVDGDVHAMSDEFWIEPHPEELKAQ